MKKIIYVISTCNVIIEYPNYLTFIINTIFPRLKVTIEKPKLKGNKADCIIMDEFETINSFSRKHLTIKEKESAQDIRKT